MTTTSERDVYEEQDEYVPGAGDPDDDYDDGYGGDPDGEDDGYLPSLDSGSMSVQIGGGKGGPNGSERGYSEINAKETEVRFDALVNFLKDFRPNEHRTRKLVHGLLRLALRMLNAPACRRRLRFEVKEAQAKYWQSRLGKDNAEYVDEADKLLDRWGAAERQEIEIRHRRLRHGLEAVDADRPRWYTAERKKELAEQEAAVLPSAAYEYFCCRLEQQTIMREEAEDRAKGLLMVDYSELIKRIHKGEAASAEVVESSPWPLKEALAVSMEDAGDDNPHWGHYERMASSTAVGRARRGRSSWGGRNEGGDNPNAAQ